jgi:hypothetical protein
MNDDVDTRVRESIVRHTRAVTPPPPNTTTLMRRGRRQRLLRTGAKVGAAAVVAVLVVQGVSTAGRMVQFPDSTDASAQHVRTHAEAAVASGGATGPHRVPGPRALFVTKSHTYVDGRRVAVRLPWDTGAHVGRLGVAFPKPGGSNRPMLLRRDGGVVPMAAPLPRLDGAKYDGWVAADSDSPLVAWAENSSKDADIVAFDTSTMTEIARERVTCDVSGTQTGCPRPYVADSGWIFIDHGSRVIAWNPRTGRHVQVSALPSQAHHRVVTTFEDHGRTALSGLGSAWQQARSPRGVEGLLSYDGAWILDANGDPTAVNWRDPSQTIRYRPPGVVEAAEFDTDGSVLVVTSSGSGPRYTGWDCALGGACKIVVPPQRGEIRLVAWDL